MNYLLPLFPLPSAVLFPRTHMPLHIFEPRYRAMMEDIMQGEQKFGFAQLREGFENDYFGSPPIYRTITAARVLCADRLEDGRWNLIAEGIERCLVLEETQKDPYRIARVEPLAESIDPRHREECIALARQVAEVAERLATQLNEGRRVLTNLVNIHQHPAVIADVVAAMLVADPYARQSILDEPNVHRRLRLVDVQVRSLAEQLEQRGQHAPESTESDSV